MDKTTYFTMAVLGCSIFLSLGFIALGSLATITSVSYSDSTVTFAQWAETFAAIAVGFGLLATGWLVGSENRSRTRLGGVIGILVAIVGALNALALSAVSSSFGSNLSIYVPFGSILVLFIGFPLAMAGSVGGLLLSELEKPPAL